MTVMIATPHAGMIDPVWLDAFLQVQKPPAYFRASTHRSEVAAARNLLVTMMFQPRHANIRNASAVSADAANDTTHILFWDDDVLPPADGLMRLLAHDLPIVSGCYTSRMGPVLPIAYDRRADGGFEQLTTMREGLQQVAGVGCGFLLVKREVFERIEAPWFQFVCGADPQSSLSEDLVFCQLAHEAGYPISMDFGVQCGHIGRYVYDRADMPAVVTPAKPRRPRKAG